MELHVNRRIRDKAMVFGLPANRFMTCLAIMCAPVVFVLFKPAAIVVWVPWMIAVYGFVRHRGRLVRSWRADRRFPTSIKNR